MQTTQVSIPKPATAATTTPQTLLKYKEADGPDPTGGFVSGIANEELAPIDNDAAH